MPLITVLVGLPGSGKSTWVKDVLVPDEAVAIIGTDIVLDRYAAQEGITYNEAFSKYYKDAEREMYDELAFAIAEQKNVIWDQTNLSAKKRKHILSQFPKSYYSQAIVFECRDQIQYWNRLKERAKVGKTIPISHIKNMEKTFQMPVLEEGFREILTVFTEQNNDH